MNAGAVELVIALATLSVIVYLGFKLARALWRSITLTRREDRRRYVPRCKPPPLN